MTPLHEGKKTKGDFGRLLKTKPTETFKALIKMLLLYILQRAFMLPFHHSIFVTLRFVIPRRLGWS